MNHVTLMGRLTKDPDIRYTQSDKPMCIARFTLAVDRRFKKQGEQSADFISCVAFGKTGEFIEKHCKKGTKLGVVGHINTGSYTNKDGNKVFTTDVNVDEVEFAESKAAASAQAQQTAPTGNNINDYVNSMPSMEDLPFA